MNNVLIIYERVYMKILFYIVVILCYGVWGLKGYIKEKISTNALKINDRK